MGIVAASLTSEACVIYFWGPRRTGPLCSQRTARCTKTLLILFRTRLTIPCEQIEPQRTLYLQHYSGKMLVAKSGLCLERFLRFVQIEGVAG